MAEIDPVAHYGFQRSEIPSQALEKLDLLGSDIQHHADIEVIRRTADMEKEHDDISIPYHIKVPMAHMEFQLKTLSVPAFLFGIQGRLFDTPAFLEKIMGPGIKALKNAATGRGDVAAHLQKAGRYKTLRHLILVTSKTSPKKALKIVMEKNPHGLSEEGAKKLILMAGKAMSLIGKKPRQIGYGLGFLTAVLAGAAYYFAGRIYISAYISAFLPVPNPVIIADGLAGLLALGIGYMVARIYAKHALQKSLEDLFKK